MSKSNETLFPSAQVRYAAEITYRVANPDKDYVASKSQLFEKRCLASAGKGAKGVSESVVREIAYQMLDESSEKILLEVLGLKKR